MGFARFSGRAGLRLASGCAPILEVVGVGFGEILVMVVGRYWVLRRFIACVVRD